MSKLFHKNHGNLNIAMWNINGFTPNKSLDDDFLKTISNVHLLSLVETWSGGDNPDISIPGFSLISNSSRKKHKKARRFSGGISIYVKNGLSKGISKLPYSNSDIVWIRLDKNFFNLKKTTFLGVIYFSPENSSGTCQDLNDLYSKLLSDVAQYSSQDVIIQGDFNAYTNTNPDFVTSDDSPFPVSDNQHYVFDSPSPRNNLDKKQPNNSGKLLLNLCKETGLKILNGRTIGDLQGKYTCMTYNRCSLVDYTLVSPNLLQGIGSFSVSNMTPISDHCLIICCLLTCFHNRKTKDTLDTLPGKFIWNTESIEKYKSIKLTKCTDTT